MTVMADYPDEPEPSLDNVLDAPSYAQIGWMKRNVEALGGVMLSGVCRPRGIAYPHPDLPGRSVMVNTQGCGNDTLALIPTPGHDEATKVCLVCDGFIEWPRGDGVEATGGDPDPPPFLGGGEAGWLKPR